MKKTAIPKDVFSWRINFASDCSANYGDNILLTTTLKDMSKKQRNNFAKKVSDQIRRVILKAMENNKGVPV